MSTRIASRRTPWLAFPGVEICDADENSVSKHPAYVAAKSGDADAANEVIKQFVNTKFLEDLKSHIVGDETPIVAAVHAEEEFGRNQIAAVFAGYIAEHFDLRLDFSVVQSNIVNHTKASGWAKLARQAEFDGPVRKNTSYLLVDDFVGQGGTLANFRGHFTRAGARVLGACVLTGKPYSAKLSLSETNFSLLGAKYGHTIDNLCRALFGFPADCLTESEARWLAKAESLDAVRIEILAYR